MNERLPSLNALRAFDAAARHMSFQAAAEELHVTPAALSYQIRQLEEGLDLKLFTRLNRAVELTHEGELIRPYIREGFSQFSEAVKKLNQKRTSNILNISAGPALTSKILAPRLYDFILQHPTIDARVSATLSLVDLKHQEFDIAIRFGMGDYAGCTSVKLFDEYVMPLCSPKLLEGPNKIQSPRDLEKFTLIHDDTHKDNPEISNWDTWLTAAGVKGLESQSTLHFNSADHALDAAAAGAGIVLGRELLAKGDINAKRLVAPFDLKLKAEFSFYAVFLENRAEEANIKKFCDWLIAEQ